MIASSCLKLTLSVVIECLLLCSFASHLSEAASSNNAVSSVSSATLTTTSSSANQNKENNHHSTRVTSSPFVSAAAEAAAAAALGGIDVGRSLVTALLGAPAASSTPSPKTHHVIMKTGSSSERQNVTIIQQKQQVTSAPNQMIATLIISSQASTSVPHRTSSSTNSSSLHKHSGKIINVSDTLHKFDLFLDPVCEQILKLTSKQLAKVHAQLRQFSQLNNNALARCFAGHGFHVDPSSGQQSGPSRDNLANLCSARSLANGPYRQFSACAAKTWTKSIDTEIDRALKDRLQVNKVNTASKATNQQLTSAEMSLIDDIVAQLQDGQVQEITTEILGSGSNKSTPILSQVINLQSPGGKSEIPAGGSSNIGKLNHTESLPSASIVSKSSESLSGGKNEHSASKPVSNTTTTTTTTTTSTTTTTRNTSNLQAANHHTVHSTSKPAGAVEDLIHSASNLEITVRKLPTTTMTPVNTVSQEIATKQLIVTAADKINLVQQFPSADLQLRPTTSQPTRPEASGSSIQVVEQHKSQSMDLSGGSKSIKLTTGGTTTSQTLNNQTGVELVPHPVPQPLIPVQALPQQPLLAQPPTSSPPPPAVIPAPPIGAGFIANQQVGNTPSLPTVMAPAAQTPPPPVLAPTISPLANMLLNSFELTTGKPTGDNSSDQTKGPLSTDNFLTVAAVGSALGVPAESAKPVGPDPVSPAAPGLLGHPQTVPVQQPLAASPKFPLPPQPVQPQAANNLANQPPPPLPVQPQATNNLANQPQPPSMSLLPLAPKAPPEPSGLLQPPSLKHETAVEAVVAASGPVSPLPLAPGPALSAMAAQPPEPIPPIVNRPTGPTGLIMEAANGAAPVASETISAELHDQFDPDHAQGAPLASSVVIDSAATTGATVTSTGVEASAKVGHNELALAQAPAGPAGLKMEHAMLVNVDRALDVLNANTIKSTTTSTARPKLEVLNTIISGKADPTGKRGSTTAAPFSVIIVDDRKPESSSRSEEEHKSDPTEITVHDVIVVGEHVEGDDLISDHKDHSESHHASKEEHKSKNSHEHDEYDPKIEHKGQHSSTEFKKSVTTVVEKKIGKSGEARHEEDHSDHEHILEGLRDGDVIHIEAGQLDGHETDSSK